MSDTTRRGFLVFAGGGAAAAVGVAAGAAMAGPDDAPKAAAPADVAITESFVVYVKDVRRGRMAILVGDREVLIEDRELASRLAGRTTA